MVIRYRSKILQWRMLPTHSPALNSARIAFKNVIDITGRVKLDRVIYMGENYHAKFHINLEISSKFVRASHAVFMMLFLSKKMNILTSKRYYFLSLQGLIFCSHTRLLSLAQKPMLLAV